jgi:hypothetical protein
MGDRPEWIRCIKHTHADRLKESWCGRTLYSFDWAFQDIDHAVYSIQSEARQVPCPACLEAIRVIMDTDP